MNDNTNMQKPTISGSDLLLPPDQFVDRCVELFKGETEFDSVSPADRRALVEAIRAGVSKLAIIDAFETRREPMSRHMSSKYDDLSGSWDSFVSLDLLSRFAPDDDDAFVRQTFFQVKGRDPTEHEAISARIQLSTLGVDRSAYIEKLVQGDHSVQLASQRSPIGHADWNFIDHDGKRTAVLVRLTEEGLSVAPGMTVPRSPFANGTLQCTQGWLLWGPKRNLASGTWDVHLCLSQHSEGALLFDVIANSGAATLARCHLIGSAYFNMRIQVEPWHQFVEVRLYKPEQSPDLSWLRIQRIALSEAL